MASFNEYMIDYKMQLGRGVIQRAYRGLMEYVMDLRTHLQHEYPDYFISGVYQGYMDMTYFSFTPRMLQERKLKIAIVFVYDKFRFEVWLAGVNKGVQGRYWELFRDSGWNRYQVVPIGKGVDSILEHVLVIDPDFGDLEALTEQIRVEASRFISDIEGFLYRNDELE